MYWSDNMREDGRLNYSPQSAMVARTEVIHVKQTQVRTRTVQYYARPFKGRATKKTERPSGLDCGLSTARGELPEAESCLFRQASHSPSASSRARSREVEGEEEEEEEE